MNTSCELHSCLRKEARIQLGKWERVSLVMRKKLYEFDITDFLADVQTKNFLGIKMKFLKKVNMHMYVMPS